VFSLRLLRRLAIKHGFGHSFKWDTKGAGGELGPSRVARYVSKYVGKSVDALQRVPWPSPEYLGQRVTRFRVWTRSRAWGASMAEVGGKRSGVTQKAESPEGVRLGLAVGEPLDLSHRYSLEALRLFPLPALIERHRSV